MLTKDEIIKAQSQKVYIHNILIQNTEYRLTLTELKAVLFLISKITPYDKPEKEYFFSVKEFCSVCNYNHTSGGSRYDYTREMIYRLHEKTIVIHQPTGKPLVTGWFAEAEFDEEMNGFSVSFAPKMKNYLFKLTQNFTSVWLECVLPMKSVYGILLFMYLSSVAYKGHKHAVELDELRRLMGCEGKYEQSSDVRKYVLEPALKDINAYTDRAVSYQFIKTGRKVSGIEFLTAPNPEDFHKRLFNRQKALGQR